MILNLGVCLGNFLGTSLGDHFGRKPVFGSSVFLAGIIGLLSAFSPYYSVFVTAVFFRGILAGVKLCSFSSN